MDKNFMFQSTVEMPVLYFCKLHYQSKNRQTPW